MAFETPYNFPGRSATPAAYDPVRADLQRIQHQIFPGLDKPSASNNGAPALTYGEHTCGGWEIAWAQIVGPSHRISEDSLGYAMHCRYDAPGPDKHAPHGVSLVLADGVGGGARGDIASHALVRHCLAIGSLHANANATHPGLLLEGLSTADSAVNRSLAARTPLPGAATLAAAWLDSRAQGWISRVGDARLSIWNIHTGQLLPLLADQSYANLGELPPHPSHWSAPARMVGAGLMGAPEVHPLSLAAQEILMLSSDGLHQWLSSADTLPRQGVSGTRLADFAQALAMHARETGSDDDISVLLLRAPNPIS